MLSKLSRTALLATAVLSGTVLLASATHASPCPFKQRLNSNSFSSDAPSDLSNTQLNIDQPDVNKLEIVGAGLAALLGLSIGGLFLKARLAKHQEADAAIPPISSPETYAEFPVFPIEVPAEALTATDQQETETKQPIP